MSTLFGSALEGEHRKTVALHLLEAQRARLVLRGRRALLLHLLEHGTGTIDHVRAVVAIPPGVNPVAIGAVPGALAAAKIIRRETFAATGRATAHARPVTVWALADADAARNWLAAHPDVPEPESDSADPFAI